MSSYFQQPSIHASATIENDQILLAFTSTSFLLSVCAILTTLYLIHNDYAAFKSLGPGGTPCNLLGYLRVKFLSLFALRDPYSPAPVPTSLQPQTGYLSANGTAKLPKRAGPRPAVRGIAPHRQINQRAPLDAFAALWNAIDELAEGHESQLRKGTSCLEKHGPGLFALRPVTRTRNCAGEVCHAHPSDGSLHLTLHPADARVLLGQSWGERHPLARGGWLSRFVPAGFVMVYAPRNEEEVEVVRRIVAAAIWWIGGIDALCEEEERAMEDVKKVASGLGEGCQLAGVVQNK